MRFALIGFCLAALAIGCSRESNVGGPGAKEKEQGVKAADNTFTLKVPSTSTGIEQGTRDEVTVSIDRGSAFKQRVALRITPPQGVKVSPAGAAFESGQSELKLTVEAAADATLGDANIEVSGVPETGDPVKVQLPITVKKP